MRRESGALLGAALLLTVGSGSAAQAANPNTLPAGPGRDLVYATCQTCHSLQALTESAGIDRGSWSGIIATMKQYGLAVSPANEAKILDYLATYLGPHPPPAAPAVAETGPKVVNSETLFLINCATCHQPDGKGSPGYFPPLAGNSDLFLTRIYPAYVVLNGLSGEITVDGKTFNGEMPSFRDLSDAEIAAIIDYERSAWDNKALAPQGLTPLDAAAVKEARAKPMTPNEVHAYRATHEPTR